MTNILRAFAILVAASTVVAGAADLSAADVFAGLDRERNTKFAITEYWKSVNGKQITWSGVVVDFSTWSREARVYVADTEQPLFRGYNIMVKSYDDDKVAALKKGQTVRFTGELDEYKVQDDRVVITIARARLLP